MHHKHFTAARSVLCLNGDLPDHNFFAIDKPIIAADGAANQLLKIGVKPFVIIGDLDSVAPGISPDIKRIHLSDQNQSDFEKAMIYLADNELLPTLVCGISGGFLDHIINNINIVLANKCIFYSPPIIGYTLTDPSKFDLQLDISTKLSLFGMPRALVRTSGLKWELNNATLEFPGSNSCFNRTTSNHIAIEVIEGTLLLLIYCTHIEDMGIL